MTEPANIAAFNRAAVFVLDRCYSTFPVPADFPLTETAVELVDLTRQDAAVEMFAKMELLPYTLRFLCDEGFLRIMAETLDGSFHGVQLTLRGLTLLGLPDPLDETQRVTLGERVKKAAADGSAKALSETVKAFLMAGVKVAFSNVSGDGGGSGMSA